MRHGALVSLAYTFFIEAFVGNMPGMAQRLALDEGARFFVQKPYESQAVLAALAAAAEPGCVGAARDV